MLQTKCWQSFAVHMIFFLQEVDITLADTDPETKKSAEVLCQALGVYEALMNYSISTWSVESQDPADKVLSLFKCHAGLVELAKVIILSVKVSLFVALTRFCVCTIPRLSPTNSVFSLVQVRHL